MDSLAVSARLISFDRHGERAVSIPSSNMVSKLSSIRACAIETIFGKCSGAICVSAMNFGFIRPCYAIIKTARKIAVGMR
jgi:hypothetical protein